MKRIEQIWNATAVLLTAGLLAMTLSSGALASAVDESEIVENAVKVQIPFIENEGQVGDEAVRFYARTFGGTLFVEDGGVVTYSLPAGNGTGAVIREFLSDREGVFPVGIEPSATKVSYFIGNDSDNWQSNLPTYNAVSLGEVYAGISLSLKAHGDNVEKIFTVEPGANPDAIMVRVEGAADALRVNETGELEIETAAGVVRFTKPVAFQERGGTREEVEVAYTVYDRETYGFIVGNYDSSRPLIIDPLLASTFIGGSGYDYAYAITIDPSGNLYVAGDTRSSNYPTTAGAYDSGHNGGLGDVFVSKLSSDLRSLLASTFIGGSSYDYARAITIDSSGNIYVAGFTYSSDYPTTGGAYDSSYNGGCDDVFVSKLSSDLGSLLASTFIGGGGGDDAYAITINSSGNVYVAGSTYSSDYPTTADAYDSSFNGGRDVFVSKLSSDLGNLSASTFIGGSSGDDARAITINSSGNVYVAGSTYSSDYPTTADAYDSSFNGGRDVFVSKLSSDLGNLSASTFIGGSNDEGVGAITIDHSGNLYVAGYTCSSDYPTTADAYDSSHGGLGDVFVSKLSSDLGSLLASTFIGGGNDEGVSAITIDSSGNPYVAGRAGNYPTTAGAYDPSYNGGGDVFVSKLSSDLGNLSASTFIGGSDGDYAYAITIDSSGNLYVAGFTYSSDYPTTADAYDYSHNSNSDVFVSKLDRELSKICACDADGNLEEQFAPGQTVYVWGNGLLANTEYRLWIQDEGVTEGRTLNMSEDPSGIQETNSTDASGTLAITGIWVINASASPTGDEWDIVADKVGAGEGTYNAADDGIDSASEVGFVAPIKLNQPPIALFTHYPEKPVANETITFNASTSFDPDGTIVNYEWDFDDGNLTNTKKPIITHSYHYEGNYNVTLTVTDNISATNSTSKLIQVSLPNVVPAVPILTPIGLVALTGLLSVIAVSRIRRRCHD